MISFKLKVIYENKKTMDEANLDNIDNPSFDSTSFFASKVKIIMI